MFGDKKRMSYEDRIFENLNNGLDDLSKAATYLNRGNFTMAQAHREAAEMRLEWHKAVTGRFEGVRDWIKELFSGNK